MINRLVSTLLIATFIWLPLTADVASAGPPSPRAELADLRGPGAQAQEIFRVRHGEKELEVLRGKEALGHLKNLKAKRRKAFEAAERDLLARGFRPTENVVVIRTVMKDASPVQSVQSDEGEIAFWAWDDGNDATWEGSVWGLRYSDGDEVINNAQADTENHYVTWEEEIYYYEPPGPYNQTTQPSMRKKVPLLASLFAAPAPHQIELVASRGAKARDWIACVIGACGAAAYACILSGPMYIECLVLSCAGAKVGCTLQWIISNWP